MFDIFKIKKKYIDEENLVITKPIVPFGDVAVYNNRVVIFGAFGIGSKTIPIKNIGNVSLGRISQKVKIETTGGQVYDFTVGGKAEEIVQAIESKI